MGQHTLRRASGISTTTGRAIFTGIAVLGLASGGAGMAFAGEASTSSSDHDVKGDHDDEGDHDGDDSDDDHGSKHHEKKHHDKHDAKPEACEIPIYANLVKDADAVDEDLTDDALKPANEASAALAKPVEDALCPVLADELNSVDDDLGHGPEGDEKKLGNSPTGL